MKIKELYNTLGKYLEYCEDGEGIGDGNVFIHYKKKYYDIRSINGATMFPEIDIEIGDCVMDFTGDNLIL